MGSGSSSPKQNSGSAKDLDSAKDNGEPPVIVKVLTPLEITRKIHTAIRWNKDFDNIKELLEPEGACDFVDPQNGNAAIHIAAQNGHTNVVELLLQKKCNMNAKNLKGNTALHMAIGYDYYETAKFLIDAGADMNATNDSDFPASAGLEGDKSLAGAAVVSASTIDQFVSALDQLKRTLPRGIKKEIFMKVGLRLKKQFKDEWDNKRMQESFTALLHDWEPEPN